MTLTINDRIYGALYGTAYGDSWGNLTEFIKYNKIMNLKPAPPVDAEITDDTQMSLYNIAALERINKIMDVENLTWNESLRNDARLIFADEHVNFYYDPDNTRAPGMTCMTSLGKYAEMQTNYMAHTGREGALSNNSKGCGANMRAMWLGLLPYSDQAIITLAIIQAETTHNSNVAGVTAAATAILMKRIVEGKHLTGDGYLMSEIIRTLENMQNGSLDWESWDERITEGIEDAILFFANKDSLYPDFVDSPYESDICKIMGAGWVADEALANAAAAADLYGSVPHHGVERLVYSSGDSDSIAAIGGAYLGAYNGREWLEGFENRLEPRYKYELHEAYKYIASLWGNHS